jgi:hypothetical protein
MHFRRPLYAWIVFSTSVPLLRLVVEQGVPAATVPLVKDDDHKTADVPDPLFT